MGLDINSVLFLIDAHEKGGRFDRVLTIGRQDLNVFPKTMFRVLRKHGLPTMEFESSDALHAEPFFRALGAKTVDSLDASSFESATIVHDLNQPLMVTARYDLVFDGGTLEHVFNFPVAIRELMGIINEGGHLILHTITNNWCGHGFYQFSPELFERIFRQENGYKLCSMIAHRVGPHARWYSVDRTERIGRRIELMSRFPIQLLIHAQRISVREDMWEFPKQIDYLARWKRMESFTAPRPALAKYFPGPARLIHALKIGLAMLWENSLANRRSFTPVAKP